MKKITKVTCNGDWTPYRNKWGHWVWQMPEDKSPHDLAWPGIKPPETTSVPIWVEDAWYWNEGETNSCDGGNKS